MKKGVTMKGMATSLSVFVMVIVLSVSARGALVDMHDGTIYDTVTQLSWLQDAGSGGRKTWDQAVAWAASLNANGGFAALTGWRLPNADPACSMGGNCANSEMGHLYYAELRKTAGESLTSTGPFANLQTSLYWSGTEYAPNVDLAWVFYFHSGNQYVYRKSNDFYAWAVRPGVRSQETTVPGR